MNCHEYKSLIEDSLDVSLSGAPAANVRRHLAHCEECRRYLASRKAEHAALVKAVNEAYSNLRPQPNGFAERIVREVAARRARLRPRRRLFASLPRWMLAAASLAVVFVGVAFASAIAVVWRGAPATATVDLRGARPAAEEAAVRTSAAVEAAVSGETPDETGETDGWAIAESPACPKNEVPTATEGDADMDMTKSAAMAATAAVLAAAPAAAADRAESASALEPADYVQSGLVLHLDGIRNAGASAPHDGTATTWADLSGSGNYAELVQEEGDGSEWLDNGYRFARKCRWVTARRTELSGDFTVQIVCDADSDSLNNTVEFPSLIGCEEPSTVNGKANQWNPLAMFWHRSNRDLRSMVNWQYVSRYVSPWNGEYATLVRDGQYGALFDSATNSLRASLNETARLPVSARIALGGGMFYESGVNQQTLVNARYFTGTIMSVRVYDRKLTDEELEYNRAIDENRFFGRPVPIPGREPSVTNVVVATQYAGVDGNEPCGAYAISAGGRTFSAPASRTVGDDTFEAAGYTLETWDAATESWGAASTHAGTSCALSDASAKARLTWLWTHTSGYGRDLAFNDYAAKDSLLLHLDGIRNVGAASAHSATSRTWIDLSRSDSWAEFVKAAGDGSGWSANGYEFAGAAYGALSATRDFGTNFTVQVVSDVDFDRQPSWYPTLFGNSFDCCNVFQTMTDGSLQFKADAQTGLNGNTRSIMPSWGGRFLTAVLDGGRQALFEGDAAENWKEGAYATAIGACDWTFFGEAGGASVLKSHYMAGRLHALRVYNRTLTDAEIASNRVVDAARFFGDAPSRDTFAVVVRSDTDGVEGVQPGGDYTPGGYSAGAVPSLSYTFTAPSTASAGGKSYELAGYTLERWNGATGLWTVEETRTDGAAAWTTPMEADWASRRLTWNWRVASGIDRIDCDVDAYVQDGLVLHFDGIRNAGAEAAHDGAATTWKDLSATANDATFTNGGESRWLDSGYLFDGNTSYAMLDAAQSFGPKFTIQVVGDVDSGDEVQLQPNLLPMLLGDPNDRLTIFMGNQSTAAGRKQLCMKAHFLNPDGEFETDASGKPSPWYPAAISSWGGRYVTAVHNGNRSKNASGIRLFQDAVSFNGYPYAKNDETVGMGTNRYCIGGVPGKSINSLKGTIHAVRVYNRVLSNAELAKNREVDERRFGDSGWNVLVAQGDYDTTTEAPGRYRVGGSWTFTADSAVGDNGKKVKVSGCYVSRWNSADGTWGPRRFYSGKSFTYTAVPPPAEERIKLTWSWNMQGFAIAIQ